MHLRPVADADAALYVGYPVAATADEAITVPALLISPNYGLIVFDVRAAVQPEDLPELKERQDDIVLAIKAKLLQHRGLTRGSDLAIAINPLNVLSSRSRDPQRCRRSDGQLGDDRRCLASMPTVR